MWNLFRSKPVAEPFPKPAWPPIQNLESLDIIGKRKGGGVDLVITASQPLDDSLETLDSIRRKVRTYLEAFGLEGFQVEFGFPPKDQCAIIMMCEHAIHASAQAVIEECRAEAAARGLRLEVRKLMGRS